MLIDIPNKVLIIVAHQDDETIGCGGTIYKWSKTNNCEINILFITDGQTGIDQRNLYDLKNIKTTRMQEATSVAKYLGIHSVNTLNIACQEVNEKSQKLFHDIIFQIRNIKPDLVLTHSPQDKHRDHQAVSKLVIEACWKANEDIHSELGKIHAITDIWGLEITDLHEKCDFIVKLTNEDFKAKIAAFELYTSQQKVIKGMKF